MRLVLHSELPDDAVLRHQWNELVGHMECPEVFYTYEWALAASRAYRDSVTPLFMMAYEQDSLVGVVALAIDNASRETRFLGSATADYCDFVSSSTRRAEFVDLVFQELRRLKIPALLAANLPADSATSRVLTAIRRVHGYVTFSRPAFQCALIAMGSPVERCNLKDRVASRKAFRYSLKALGKHGAVYVDHLRSYESLQTVLPEFIRAHIARFAITGRSSNLARPERQVFLTELAGLLSAAGWIVLTRFRVGSRAVAWNYGFRFCGSWFYYQPTFDTDWREFSPGFCLLSKIVEAACDDLEIRRIDLGLGAEGYKERFATGTRQTLNVTATASTARYFREAARYHAAAIIKSSPRLESGVRWMRSHVPVGGGQD